MKTIQFDKLTIYQFTWDIVDSNCYVIREGNSCLLFDPIDSNELFTFLSSFDMSDCTVILTHAHFDHICGLNRLRVFFQNCRVICSKQCSENIQDPRRNLSNMANAYISFHNKSDVINHCIEPFFCDPGNETFEDKSELKWKEHVLKFFEVKGHSPDSICCVMDESLLFSGDTLLSIPVVTRFPRGSTNAYKEHDLPLLRKVTKDISFVCPGHGRCDIPQNMSWPE